MAGQTRTITLFFFNDTATTEIYTLSLHDALPISRPRRASYCAPSLLRRTGRPPGRNASARRRMRSEEHTSELQSQSNLVCRLLLEKKDKTAAVARRVAMPASTTGQKQGSMN